MKDVVLRKVKKDDCRDIWLWRNHPDVRKDFFDTNIIKWQEHIKWFFLKLREPSTKLYIAKIDRDKVGIIRFEEEGGFSKVSVNLNPRFFKRGLGSRIIRAGTEKYSTEMSGRRPIIAAIKDDNIVSQRAFEKAGYIFARKANKKMIFQMRDKKMPLYGKKIYLRPLERKDINKRYLSWLRDSETTRFVESGKYFATLKSLNEYYDKIRNSTRDVMFAIVTKNKDRHIGNIKLGNINRRHGYGSLGIMIGEKRYWGRGYGQEACRLLLKYAFEGIGLNKVILGVYANHPQAIRAYKKVGFRVEGRIRKLLDFEGKFVDKVIMGIMGTDFKPVSRVRQK